MSEPVEIQLPSLMVAFGTAALTVGLAYVVPGLEHYQPWKPGDPIPVLSSLTPKGAPRVEEDDRAGLVFSEAEPVEEAPPEALPEEPPPAGEPPAAVAPAAVAGAQTPVSSDVTLAGVTPNPAGAEGQNVDPAAGQVVADNPPEPAPAPSAAVPSKYKAGFVTPLEDPGHVGIRAYFQALKRTGEGGVARALHYGDSTIAADGLARTIRTRLQARFGNAGPGFVSAGMDPRWNKRTDVDSSR
ncbi:MAG TPA: hypothetical protein PLA94_26135, partial [Myxococcota bacterium]|nr:hypothetical protein [Myxococcota bacterium]